MLRFQRIRWREFQGAGHLDGQPQIGEGAAQARWQFLDAFQVWSFSLTGGLASPGLDHHERNKKYLRIIRDPLALSHELLPLRV
jgi:hypothetical protein